MIRNLIVLGLALSFSISSFAITETDVSQSQTTPPPNPETIYSVDYIKKSPIKTVPLQNATLKIRVYYNGNPMGVEEVKTDENNNFTFDKYKDFKSIRIEIASITDQHKYNARCYDSTDSYQLHQLKIICVPVKKS